MVRYRSWPAVSYKISVKSIQCSKAVATTSVTNPNLQLHTFVMTENSFHFEINADRWYERRSEWIVSIAEEEAGFSNTRIADDQQFEHVIEILVGRIFLPFWITTASHLKRANLFTLNWFFLTNKLKWIQVFFSADGRGQITDWMKFNFHFTFYCWWQFISSPFVSIYIKVYSLVRRTWIVTALNPQHIQCSARIPRCCWMQTFHLTFM